MLRVSVVSQMALLHLGLSEASVEREKMFFYRLVKGLKLFAKTYFYTPEIEDRGAYCFCLSFCPSLEILTLLITF